MTNEIIIPEVADAQLQNCLIYVLNYNRKKPDGKRVTKAEVAEAIGITLPTLRAWIVKWEQDGTMERARAISQLPKLEELAAVGDEVLAEWPDIIRDMMDIVRGRGSTKANARTKWEIASWLHEVYIKPAQESAEKADSKAARFADLETDFDVLNVAPGQDVLVPKED